MSDLRAREGSSAEWEGEVVELVEEGHVVGIVYLDGETVFAEFVPAVDNEPWSFEVADLQTALDTASAMLLPEGTSMLTAEASAGEIAADGDHPVDRLAAEFDHLASRRGEEDEGFYPTPVAAKLTAVAEQLGLAVVSVEGFRLDTDMTISIPGMAVDTGDAHDGEPWPVFKAGCNVQAAAVLESWGKQPGVFVAVEVADSGGDRYVL